MINNKRLAFIVLIAGILSTPQIYAELRDPTRPPASFNGEAPVSSNLFLLNATIIAPDHKIAVINGVDKRIGDEILGQYITDINENTVQLTGPNGKITLFLIGKSIKNLPSTKREKNICTEVKKEFYSFR